MNKLHTFHIPVMGVAYSIDSPIRISHLGINSSISLLDDALLEKLRKFYSERFDLPYSEISKKCKDARARRISLYLDMVKKISDSKFNKLKNSSLSDFLKSCELLPESSPIKIEFKRLSNLNYSLSKIRDQIKEKLSQGSIDVNIMTKVDRTNYKNGEALPVEYNDAHAAIRGYAESSLESSVILSAGMNPRLFSYMEKFDDFFPDAKARIKKKIILKVSDFRSALIQGKFLAKKGLWVSEYRIESGLNCGGHAFATNGILLGPVLEEFKSRREELKQTIYKTISSVLDKKEKTTEIDQLPLQISAQGGVGTNEEHNLLLNEYNIDSVGWGTPFLLVPEATCINTDTINRLEKAKSDDLYLSGVSPLGVPFNNLRGNTKEQEQINAALNNQPGSNCPKQYVKLNKEFSKEGMCTASRAYQKKKIEELKTKDLTDAEYKIEYNKIVEKACICVGLGTPALLKYDIDHKVEGDGVTVCPGPNMEYFDKQMSLRTICDHIYGVNDVLESTKRPHFFINEIKLYLKFIKNRISQIDETNQDKEKTEIREFISNMLNGIEYYNDLFRRISVDKYNLDLLNKLELELKGIRI